MENTTNRYRSLLRIPEGRMLLGT